MTESLYTPADDVVSRRVGAVAVLVRLSTNRIYELNATGARFWDLIRDGASRDAIVQQIGEEFDVAPQVVDAEFASLIDMLRGEGLVR